MRARRHGFTLLEVMVALAILGLGLTAILSAQAGSFSSAAHARNLSVATGLARCKMSELEEKVLRDGLPELDENDSGPCCGDDDAPGMHCSWRIEKPELPEPKYGELDLDTNVGSSNLGSLGALSQAGKDGSFGKDAKIGDIAQTLIGSQGGDDTSGAAGAADGVFGMVMDLVYPDLKSLFEASARRVTVKIAWEEGQREHTIEVVQWVTFPQKGLPPIPPDGATSEEEESANPTPAPRNTGGKGPR